MQTSCKTNVESKVFFLVTARYSMQKGFVKKRAAIIAGWIISLLLFYILLRNIDLKQLLHQISRANPIFLAGACVLNLGVVLLKSLRWHWITSPDLRAPFAITNEATFIGMAGNNLLPARAGDIMKIMMLKRHSGMSKLGLVSLTGVEKLFDAFAMALIAAYLLYSAVPSDIVGHGLKIILIILAAGAAVCLAIKIMHNKELLPNCLKGLFARFASGLEILTAKKRLAVTLVSSVLIALFQVATLALCQKAIANELNMLAVAFVFVAINLAIVVPSAPSNLGPFEFAAVYAFGLFHIGKEAALGIAISYHAIQALPITAIGLYFLARNGIRLGKNFDESSSKDEDAKVRCTT